MISSQPLIFFLLLCDDGQALLQSYKSFYESNIIDRFILFCRS
jgi:hypothetical protein